jgi:hypothetical protein
MHDAERVLEARVHGTGVDVIRPGQLADLTQPLESQLINNRPLPDVDFNKRGSECRREQSSLRPPAGSFGFRVRASRSVVSGGK